MTADGKSKTRPVAENRKARFSYDIIDTVEAGLVLTGTEVKSLREGRANIQESYAAGPTFRKATPPRTAGSG